MISIDFLHGMQLIGNFIDLLGVIVIILGILASTVMFVINIYHNDVTFAYPLYRQSVGKAILLGLEFLVAGDIIRTVAVSPNLTNVFILAGIVLIRTFLSIALQLEIDRRWPWQSTSEPLKNQRANT